MSPGVTAVPGVSVGPHRFGPRFGAMPMHHDLGDEVGKPLSYRPADARRRPGDNAVEPSSVVAMTEANRSWGLLLPVR